LDTKAVPATHVLRKIEIEAGFYKESLPVYIDENNALLKEKLE